MSLLCFVALCITSLLFSFFRSGGTGFIHALVNYFLKCIYTLTMERPSSFVCVLEDNTMPFRHSFFFFLVNDVISISLHLASDPKSSVHALSIRIEAQIQRVEDLG